MSTTYKNKLQILSTFWLNHRYDDEYVDFINYNDVGLPLAYVICEAIVESTDTTSGLIEETFDNLLVAHGIDDEGFDSLDSLFAHAEA